MEKIKQVFLSGVELLKGFLHRVKNTVINVSLDVVVGVLGVMIGVPLVIGSGVIGGVKSYLTEGFRGVIREIREVVGGVVSLMIGGTPIVIGCLSLITSFECLIMGLKKPVFSRSVRHVLNDTIDSVVGILMLPLVVLVDRSSPQEQPQQ